MNELKDGEEAGVAAMCGRTLKGRLEVKGQHG